MEAAKAAGAALLAVGIGLVLFTFYCAYNAFLEAAQLKLLVTGAANPWEAFTAVLGPLVKSCIMVMFLGVMGWAGVTLTSRGAQLFRTPLPKAPARAPPRPLPSAPAPPPSAPPTAYPGVESA